MNPSQHAEQFQSQLAKLCATVHSRILAGVVDHCRSIAGWDVVGAGAACLASCSWREEISHRSW
ncbi:Uncharacterised protein [Escherichia coli]|uniref:Uncharacterized protein n=1 Tax=Escherichia coli TaxID=562 RepID=A0A376WZM7_ECOLX|nr:Uncharacterised protein [Escherichia coli]